MTVQSLLTSRIIKYLVVAVTIFVSIGLVRTLYQSLQLTKVPEGNLEIIAQLEAEKALITNQLETSQHPFALEKIIRDELNMTKDGERVIQLPPLPDPSPLATPTPVPSQAPWREWQQLIF